MTSDNNLGPAEETYSGFLSLLKIGTIASIIVVTLVVILIS
ncbi:aa3-type cytochrome c oxidase subunit IV [Sphingorhabdus sp. 109]|nr:aa3-type cytochrome c oxidase subunit IV [Sphingorhabdus sp. 109]